jgi:hypothetical protein
VRLAQPAQKKLTQLLSKINKKSFGKRVKSNELIWMSLSLITDAHIRELQEGSLSNSDKLEMKYKDFIKANGPVTKDEFLGYLLSQNTVAKKEA